MVILVKSIVGDCDTAEQGAAVYGKLRASLNNSPDVTLDFSGVSNVTSSFVNVAFVQLLSDFSFDSIRQNTKLININSQIADMIKTRMSAESSRKNMAA